MWLLPTRNRQESVKELIASMQAVGELPKVAVMIDGPHYDIDWPSHWHIYQSNDHLELQKAINWLFEKHPNEPFYGFLADHARPRTPDWSAKLAKSAGNIHVALPNTGRDAFHPKTGIRRMGYPCFGGDLIRAIGWILLPTTVHLYGDDVLEDICYGLDLVKYEPSILVNHLSLRDGEIKFDDNHKRIWKGQSYVERDRQAYIAWKRNMFPSLMQQLREKLCLQSLAS